MNHHNSNSGDCCEHIKPIASNDENVSLSVGEYFSCPMHPEIQQDKPGMCPECGMALIKVKSKKLKVKSGLPRGAGEKGGYQGYDKHKGHHKSDFIKKFWITVALTVPIFVYSDLPKIFFGWAAPQFVGEGYVSLVIGSFIFFYCGYIFLSSAYRELRARLPGMMTLIALAVTTAYVYSIYQTIIGSTHTLWWELSTLIAVMLLGHWIEMRAVQGAKGALKELAKLLPDEAEKIKSRNPNFSVQNVDTEIVAIAELKVGDLVLIRPGAKIPADGKIKNGKSELNESIITGESKLVDKDVGDEVIAGSINGDGSLIVEVLKIGENTFLSGIMRLVAEAESSKSRIQMLSDRAALWLTFVAIGSGAVTVIVWISVGAGVSTAIERLVAVLVIACPHALGLAIPLVSSISTTMGARSGLLVRRRMALESARNIDVVLFDKTGTLTEGKFVVTYVSSNEALMLAGSVNVHSEHPIGRAIVEEAKKRGLPLKDTVDFKRIAGRGAEGNIDGKKVFVGTKGGNAIVVEIDGEKIGVIAVSDAPRPESKEAIENLKKLGVRIAMVTGDSEETAKEVSDNLGLDEYFARVLPEDKIKKVSELQNRGLRVAMVGDGVNDAPALTQADIGIAIGAGTNVAVESAGIVLVKNDPRDVVKIIHLSKLTYSKMIQNLWWAAGYNIIAIPLAAGVLAGYGIFLQPALAAVFMSFSTVIVSINAVLMRKRKI